MAFRDNHESVCQPVGVLFENHADSLDLGLGALIAQTQEQDAVMPKTLAKHLISEVFVIGDENPVFAKGALKNVVVGGAARLVKYRRYIVALLAKPPGDHWSSALVDQESHLCDLGNGLRRKQQTGLNVLSRQPLVLG